jgi:hypothetical protein
MARSQAAEIGRGEISVMLKWLLRLSMVAVGPAVLASASAQGAENEIRAANVLGFQIRSLHQGTGIRMQPPGIYCRRMYTAEFVLKEITRAANEALFDGSWGLTLRLQSVANRLSDELDVEASINDQSGYHPCEGPVSSGATSIVGRASLVRGVRQRLPFCQAKANALRVTFAARRELMRECLRLINY